MKTALHRSTLSSPSPSTIQTEQILDEHSFTYANIVKEFTSTPKKQRSISPSDPSSASSKRSKISNYSGQSSEIFSPSFSQPHLPFSETYLPSSPTFTSAKLPANPPRTSPARPASSPIKPPSPTPTTNHIFTPAPTLAQPLASPPPNIPTSSVNPAANLPIKSPAKSAVNTPPSSDDSPAEDATEFDSIIPEYSTNPPTDLLDSGSEKTYSDRFNYNPLVRERKYRSRLVDNWLIQYYDSDQVSIKSNSKSALMSAAHSSSLFPAPSEFDLKHISKNREHLFEKPDYRTDALEYLGVQLVKPNLWHQIPQWVNTLTHEITRNAIDITLEDKTMELHKSLEKVWYGNDFRREEPFHKAVMKCLGLEDDFPSPLKAAEKTLFYYENIVTNPSLQNFVMAIPNPYLTVGYVGAAFKDEKKTTPPIAANAKTFQIDETPVWLPYLTVERRSSYSSDSGLLNACLGTTATCLNVVNRVMKPNAVFCLAISFDAADLFVSWSNDENTFRSKVIGSFALKDLQQCIALRKCLSNIHDWAILQRLPLIKGSFRRMGDDHSRRPTSVPTGEVQHGVGPAGWPRQGVDPYGGDLQGWLPQGGNPLNENPQGWFPQGHPQGNIPPGMMPQGAYLQEGERMATPMGYAQGPPVALPGMPPPQGLYPQGGGMAMLPLTDFNHPQGHAHNGDHGY